MRIRLVYTNGVNVTNSTNYTYSEYRKKNTIEKLNIKLIIDLLMMLLLKCKKKYNRIGYIMILNLLILILFQ